MKNTLYQLDVEKVLSVCKEDTVLRYDLLKLIVAVQGQVNREEPELYLMWQESDAFWLEYMMREGKFLHGVQLQPIEDVDRFFEVYGGFIHDCGLALWDYQVPATMNVATTACGVDGVLPLRFDEREESILQLIRRKTGAPVRLNLVNKFTGKGEIPDIGRPSSGSAKCDAYLWALDQYLDRTNPKLLFYTLDACSWDDSKPYYPDLGNAFVPNHDYAIAKRAFVFDLSSYGDELPCDDPDQPLGTDLNTMKEILKRQYDRTFGKEMITVCGFNPWQQKYTTHLNKGKHDGVPAEWQFTEVISAYNCVKDADAYGMCGLANASVFSHYPLKKKYTNRKPKPGQVYDPNKTYILFYVGDYDAAAWTCRMIPKWYQDENLGKYPLMWCFNPNLSDRIPQAFDFIYENYTDNDFFEAGDSGAGYNNPRLLYPPRVHSDLPSGAETYVKHNQYYFDKFDMHIIGFIINGYYLTDKQQMRDIARFATEGAGHNGYGDPTKIVDGAVFMPHTWDMAQGHEQKSADELAQIALKHIDECPKNKKFHLFRTILISPTFHDELVQALRRARPEANFELVDPHTFFRFAKEAKEKGLTY